MTKRIGYISKLKPGRIPVRCSYDPDHWQGFVMVSRGQRIDKEGCRVIDADGKDHLMICPKCLDGGHRAIFYKASKINEAGGKVLFYEDLPASKRRGTVDLNISDLTRSKFFGGQEQF